MNQPKNIEQFWNDYRTAVSLPDDVCYSEAFHFELTEELADYLAELVVSGQKRATSSSLAGYEIEGESLPQVGEYSIITDWAGHPRCIIVTTAVTIIPFREITFDICRREGEDDTLQSWQASHRDFFTAEGELLGYTFTEDMPVIFEDFRVVYTDRDGVIG